MEPMLANRYLLDGKANLALELYRQALIEEPRQSDLQCRFILASMELERVDEAAGFIGVMLDEYGPEALEKLQCGCFGFGPNDRPGEQDAGVGLRALMAGDVEQARQRLGLADPERFPAVAALAKRLEWFGVDMPAARH